MKLKNVFIILLLLASVMAIILLYIFQKQQDVRMSDNIPRQRVESMPTEADKKQALLDFLDNNKTASKEEKQELLDFLDNNKKTVSEKDKQELMDFLDNN